MKKFFLELKKKIETINGGKELIYEKRLCKNDDDVPLNKQLKFPTVAIIIRCIFQKGKKLDPQIYLDECLYESV